MSGLEKANNMERETWSSRSSPGERRGRNSGAAADGDASGPPGSEEGIKVLVQQEASSGCP